MKITYKKISTDEQYHEYLEEFEKLMDIDPKEGTEESDKFDLLALLINDYEEKHYKIEMPDPIEAIKFRMEQMGLRNKDLIDIIGSKSKVSEVLNNKVSLSLNMIKKLHAILGIPAEILIQSTDSYKTVHDNLLAVGESKVKYGEEGSNSTVEK